MRSSESVARPGPEPPLRSIVAGCRDSPALMAELRELYRQADRAVAEARLTCLGGGGCCRFDLFGHRLYVTAPELALLTAEPPPKRPQPMRCCYQIGPECRAYARRPLGCRTFFCRSAGSDVAERVHEDLHGRLRRLHQTHCIPYRYAEMCGLLRELYAGG